MPAKPAVSRSSSVMLLGPCGLPCKPSSESSDFRLVQPVDASDVLPQEGGMLRTDIINWPVATRLIRSNLILEVAADYSSRVIDLRGSQS